MNPSRNQLLLVYYEDQLTYHGRVLLEHYPVSLHSLSTVAHDVADYELVEALGGTSQLDMTVVFESSFVVIR